jgi:hypothetical protein
MSPACPISYTLYCYEAWRVTLTEGYRGAVFEEDIQEDIQNIQKALTVGPTV